MSKKSLAGVIVFFALSALYDFIIKPELQRQINEGSNNAFE